MVKIKKTRKTRTRNKKTRNKKTRNRIKGGASANRGPLSEIEIRSRLDEIRPILVEIISKRDKVDFSMKQIKQRYSENPVPDQLPKIKDELKMLDRSYWDLTREYGTLKDEEGHLIVSLKDLVDASRAPRPSTKEEEDRYQKGKFEDRSAGNAFAKRREDLEKRSRYSSMADRLSLDML